MIRRFVSAVVLADLIGAVGVLADASITGPPITWNAIVFFGGLPIMFAALPLAIGMGLSLLVLFKVDHPAWADSPWAAPAIGAVAGLLVWALFTGSRVPGIGIGYGAAAGSSLWVFFRGEFRECRSA